MKKILFVTSQLLIGGTETALYETVKALKSPAVDITVAVMKPGGELYDDFKKICNIKDLSDQYSNALITKENIVSNLKHLHLIAFVKNLILKIKEKYLLSHFKFKESIAKRMPQDADAYDVAIAYSAPYTSHEIYVLEKVNAQKKLAWIHFDVASYIKETDASGFSASYEKFDNVICVSEASEKSFITRHPSLAKKTQVVYNPVDTERILSLSKEAVDVKANDGITLCSVGRLAYDKGFDMAISAHKLLKNKGYNVKWLLCGDGDCRKALEISIKENRLENEFILLGNQKNPYKYINAADIYVQTSRTESYCLTLAEARALKKPIVTTNFACSDEHITDSHNGFICRMNAESIADAIEKLIKSPDLREKFSNNTTPIDDNNLKLKQLFE